MESLISKFVVSYFYNIHIFQHHIQFMRMYLNLILSYIEYDLEKNFTNPQEYWSLSEVVSKEILIEPHSLKKK